MPKISVLMPVHNGEKYLSLAIDSVLTQTYKDFELIIIDDGSTDKSAAIVASYADSRIHLYSSHKNLGLIGALNKGLKYCTSEYIARLDCDDFSHPERLMAQVHFLDNNQKTFLCGTWVKAFEESKIHFWNYPTENDLLRARMIFDCPFAHSSVMFRASLLGGNNNLYDKRFPLAEDYELWERISKNRQVANIPKYLTFYRIHSGQISRINARQQANSVHLIQQRLLQQLQIEPTEEEITLHFDIGVGWNFIADKARLDRTEDWLLKLAGANDRMRVFPREGFRRVLSERWFLANFAAVRTEQASWRRYGNSALSTWEPRRMRKQARLLFESMRHVL